MFQVYYYFEFLFIYLVVFLLFHYIINQNF
nr:MAG TPA: hypothetical protein [Caudoviricetes sp.]